MILRAFHPGAEYEKEVEQSASFEEDIPLSGCCLTVLSLHGVNRNAPLPISKKKEEVPVMRAAKMKERPYLPADVPDRRAEYLSYADAALVIF